MNTAPTTFTPTPRLQEPGFREEFSGLFFELCDGLRREGEELAAKGLPVSFVGKPEPSNPAPRTINEKRRVHEQIKAESAARLPQVKAELPADYLELDWK